MTAIHGWRHVSRLRGAGAASVARRRYPTRSRRSQSGFALTTTRVPAPATDELPGPKNLRSTANPARVGGWPSVAYRGMGAVGLALALVMTHVVLVTRGGSPAALLTVAVTSVATMAVLVLASSLLLDGPVLVYYQHHLAILATVAGVASLTRGDVPEQVMIATVGVGVFLTCGRVGCLLVGCCYGRPWSSGVRYGERHVRAGFPSRYAGCSLLPVQAGEAAWVALVVTVAAWMAVRGEPAARVVGSYFALYGVGRFALEFLRGDVGRPHIFGLSRAQWTAAGIGLVVAATTEVLAPVLLAALAPVVWALVLLVLPGRSRDLLSARHLADVTDKLIELEDRRSGSEDVVSSVSDRGVTLSVSADDVAVVYGLSAPNGLLPDRVAARLARHALWSRHPQALGQISRSSTGVTYLIVPRVGSCHPSPVSIGG
jgi:hypothetical protein